MTSYRQAVEEAEGRSDRVNKAVEVLLVAAEGVLDCETHERQYPELRAAIEAVRAAQKWPEPKRSP